MLGVLFILLEAVGLWDLQICRPWITSGSSGFSRVNASPTGRRLGIGSGTKALPKSLACIKYWLLAAVASLATAYGVAAAAEATAATTARPSKRCTSGKYSNQQGT